MSWVMFSYSLPSKAQSSPRVALWRRLRHLGAIAPAGGIYVLPAREECLEAFQWLAEEVQHAKGEALVMRVDHFEGLTEDDLINRFRQARAEDYAALEAKLASMQGRPSMELKADERSRMRGKLKRLRQQHADIARIDFFNAPEGDRVASQLGRLGQALATGGPSVPRLTSIAIEAYRETRWVTRPRPHVDRLACIWLIRRFINPSAVIRYAQSPGPEEVAFDMREGTFSHRGTLCTFETMVAAFGLEDQRLHLMGEIIHEIDVRDGRYAHPETAGIDAVLSGWLLTRFADQELEDHGVALFEGLFTALARRAQPQPSKKEP
jgi:hypothetical protein